jgi:hypothetical protein
MRQLTIATVIAIAGLVSVAPASADVNHGGPVKQAGQCWKNNTGNDSRFGAWIACPQPAGTTATQRAARRRG